MSNQRQQTFDINKKSYPQIAARLQIQNQPTYHQTNLSQNPEPVYQQKTSEYTINIIVVNIIQPFSLLNHPKPTKKQQKHTMNDYIVRGSQLFIAFILLVLTIIRFSWNHIGQNIINLTAVGIFILGLDNLVIVYRTYLNKQAVQFEATFVIMFLLFLGILFEKFNRSPGYFQQVNAACYIIDILVLAVNLLYLIAVLVTLGCYMIRHIYRLMTETLLTNVANLQRHEIDNILRNKKRFDEVQRLKPGVNTQCSICFLDFQRDKLCLMLPGCEHCFHVECIEEWLNQKGTCPNCRSNLRLNIV